MLGFGRNPSTDTEYSPTQQYLETAQGQPVQNVPKKKKKPVRLDSGGQLFRGELRAA
jgi:hypothetical protein